MALWAAACLLVACASASPAARRAQRLLDEGDYAGAGELAETELERTPRDGDLWRVKIRAQMGRGDNAGAVRTYARWRSLRGGDDPAALDMMAKTALWQGLRVPSSTIRAQAIRVVEERELESLARDVMELVSDSDDLVAAAAAVAVLRSHPYAPRVATDVLASENPDARATAVRGIARKVGAMARGDLLPLAGDSSPKVRRAVVEALDRFGEEEDLERLIALAQGDEDGGVRADSIRALARRAERLPLEIAERGLEDDYRGARLGAIEFLAARGDKESRLLLQRAAESGDLQVAFRALVALRKSGAEPDAELLRRGLEAEDWTVRVSALGALIEATARQDALRLAGGAIVDPRVEVRLAAARVLRRLGVTERAREEFASALGADRVGPRLSAAGDLAHLEDPRGLEVLAAIARDPNADHRRAAVRAHRLAGRPTPALVEALADPSPDLRVLAADVLLELLEEH